MTIAELTDEQIDYFLPRWCRASLLPQRTPASALPVSHVSQTTTFSREVEQKAQQLAMALKSNAAVRELAENPLLLTLMVVMQQNSIVLPTAACRIVRCGHTHIAGKPQYREKSDAHT